MWKKLSETWRDLNKPIYVGNRLKQNLQTLTAVSIFTSILGAGLFIMDIFTGQKNMLIPSIATFLGGALCAYFAGVKKDRDKAILIPTIFCAIAFTYYSVSGAGEGTAIFWVFLLPIGISYFVDVKYGIVLSIYYMILFTILFYTPLRERLAPYYSNILMIRIPILFGSVAAFTAIAMIPYHRAILLENEYADRLNAEVEKQTAIAVERANRLEHMSEEIVHMLAVAIDAKDRYTNGHSFRVAAYATALAEKLNMPQEELKTLRQEAMLHDIGKIGVPDAVLNKPGRLTSEEFEIIKSHAAIGGKILERSSDMQGAVEVANFHHERYDGKGYPTGRKGADIPYHARIVSIADAYDAMRSNRIYRKGLPKEKIREELIHGRGNQFDPVLLDEFLKMTETGELDRITDNANKELSQSIELGLLDNPGDQPEIPAENTEVSA